MTGVGLGAKPLHEMSLNLHVEVAAKQLSEVHEIFSLDHFCCQNLYTISASCFSFWGTLPQILHRSIAGFRRLLESPGKWDWSWKFLEILVESPAKSWKFLLGYDVGSGHNGLGADAKICVCAVRTSLASNKYSVTLSTQLLIRSTHISTA